MISKLLSPENILKCWLAFRIWWAVFWRVFVVFLLASLLLQWIFSQILGNMPWEWGLAFPVLLVSMHIFSLKILLGTRFGQWTWAVQDKTGQQIPVSIRIVLRVWWAFIWRFTIISCFSAVFYHLIVPLFETLPFDSMLWVGFCFCIESILAILVYRDILSRDFGAFRLAVFRNLADGNPTETSSSL